MIGISRFSNVVGVLAVLFIGQSSADVIISSGKLYSQAGPNGAIWGVQPGLFPNSSTTSIAQTVTGTARSASSSTTYNYNIDNVSDYSFMDASFTHSIDNSGSSWSNSYTNVWFTLDQATTYSITSSYTLSGTATFVQNISLHTSSWATIFDNEQTSINATNQTFTTLGADGNSVNVNIGASTGILTAGTYSFLFDMETKNAPAGSTASSSGWVNFELGTPVANNVPEPSMVIMFLAGLPGIALFIRRYRKIR